RKLASGHTVDTVVDEEHGDVLAPVGGVNDLGGADCGEIAITLVGDNDLVGMCTLHGCCHRGCASVRGLHVAGVEVVVRKDRAADRADKDSVVLCVQFLKRFGDELVHE